ncbi:MAG: type II secretion system minor pseudopilin GspK [Cocleimonas sp.]|nr:type II secretion system minor pseudopilin GspK [Cocleimonas sp.]
MRQTTQPKKQQGVALIIALVITTVAVSLASVAMYRQRIQIRLSGNISNLEQAYQYAVGMEDWSKKILEKDFKDNPNVDSLKEDWHIALPPIPIQGGALIGQLHDLQGRINLNSLLMKYAPLSRSRQPAVAGQGGGKRGNNSNSPNNNQPAVKVIKTEPLIHQRLTALITTIDKEQVLGPPENFVDILWDWIDAKDEERQGGAESGYYQSLEVPYMAANAPLMDVSELLLLKDLSKEIVDKLKPLVSTLPKDTRINLNTAPMEVLEAIGFDATTATAIKKARDETPFENINDFWNLEEVKTLFSPNSEMGDKKANYAQTLGITTEYFLLQGKVNINNTRIFINTILERKKGKVRVIRRDYGNPS